MYRIDLNYIERDSFFKRLDFRTKLLMMASVTMIAFMWENPLLVGLLNLVVIIACIIAGIKLKYLGTILKVMIPFYIFILLSMGFFNTQQVKSLTGRNELFSLVTIPEQWWLIGGGKMTLEGTLYGLNIIFTTLSMILVIPLGVFTTDTNNMIVGMVKMRIPYKIAFIFSSTLRFFPLLLQDSQSIIEAQKLRGLAIEKMGLIKRLRVYSKIAVPLILGAFIKSQQIEVVLQSKAFSGNPVRTYLHESGLERLDYLTMAFFAITITTTLILYFWLGVGRFVSL